jgi:hypothetical protein
VNVVITTSRGYDIAIPCDRAHAALVSGQGPHKLTGLCVPDVREARVRTNSKMVASLAPVD